MEPSRSQVNLKRLAAFARTEVTLLKQGVNERGDGAKGRRSGEQPMSGDSEESVKSWPRDQQALGCYAISAFKKRTGLLGFVSLLGFLGLVGLF